jgi:hypothetical protein
MPRKPHAPIRPEQRRGARYPTGAERDRYRTGDERRFQPSEDQPSEDGEHADEQAFDGDQSYGRGGYAEEVGHRKQKPKPKTED